MDGGSSFTIALVTSYDPVAVTFQEFELGPDKGPDDVFDDAHAPGGASTRSTWTRPTTRSTSPGTR